MGAELCALLEKLLIIVVSRISVHCFSRGATVALSTMLLFFRYIISIYSILLQHLPVGCLTLISLKKMNSHVRNY